MYYAVGVSFSSPNGVFLPCNHDLDFIQQLIM